jgi:uncharacterized protein YjcR
MKFKSFIDKDIEEFRRLNIGIVEKSEDEVVRKIEEKYGLQNSTANLINSLNRLLGKKKVGFTFDSLSSKKLEEQIKKINKDRAEILKMKIIESNSTFAELKRQLESKLKGE